MISGGQAGCRSVPSLTAAPDGAAGPAEIPDTTAPLYDATCSVIVTSWT